MYKSGETAEKQHLKQWLLPGAIILALFVVLGLMMTARQTAVTVFKANEAASWQLPLGAAKPSSVKMHLLVGGDVMWGRLYEREALAQNNQNFAFQTLSTLQLQNYDAWIANNECPITDNHVAFDLQWEAIQFNCRPEYVDELARYFDVMSLANNHSDNMNGQIGLDETRQHLADNDIQYFGHFDPTVLDELCEVVSLPLKVDGQGAEFPVAMCGFHGVFQVFTDEEIAAIHDYAEHFITIVMPHAGAEYQPDKDELRQTAYRAMIDQGADAVLGNHPHWVQETEAYKGKLIVYSMGNFVFDQRFNSEVTRSLAINMTIDIAYNSDVAAYLEMADSCRVYRDSCLQIARDRGLAKPDFSVTYKPIGTTTKDLQTALATPAEQQSIEARAKWSQTMSDFAAYR